MLLSSLWRVASVAAVAFLPSLASAADPDNPDGQSVFVSPGNSLAFGLTVPEHDNNDLYFNLRVKSSRSWGAVGLGSDDMKGALYLMVYKNEKGDNVTFSPRLAYGNYEPTEYKDLEIELLNGTGISDGYMNVVAKCINHCRSWPGNNIDGKGWLDVSSNNQNSIFAVGPKEGLYSDKKDAALKFHQEFGVFSIDIGRTRGQPDPPVLTNESQNEGTTLKYKEHRRWDVMSTMHATLMCMAIFILFPLGVAILRLGRWARWHGLNQGGAMIVLLAGFGMGIATSFHYRRSWHFNSYHQLFGYVIIGFFLIQFSLGFLHHTEYVKTNLPTKWGKIHLWMGRIILVLAFINIFLGFGFALNRRTGAIIAGVIVLVCVALLILTFYQQRAAKKRRQAAAFGAAASQEYGSQPWRRDTEAADERESAPPGYQHPSQQPPQSVGLQNMSPWKSAEESSKSYEDDPDLGGSSPRPRDL